MTKRFTIQLFFLLLFVLEGHSQSPFGVRQKQIMLTKKEGVVIDSLVIIPSSVSLYSDVKIDTSDIFIDYRKAKVFLKPNFYLDTVEIIVQYQTLSIATDQAYYKKDKLLIQRNMENPQNFFKIQESKPLESWMYTDSDINRSGSISRGVSAGNSQNVIVNSDMNLQLNGKLNESFNIKAAITDRNIPLQPDGNTQQLQDFDQVYIQLYNKSTQILAGDFELRNEENHFLKFSKRLLGGGVQHFQQLKDSNNIIVKTAISVSKGKYKRQDIKPMDGNQGPYKLVGENNEPFILVLAGTEKVYIDGVLKSRGELNDYTIDYNMGEITFTPKTIITKEKRIIVEFEYSDKNYSRTFTHNHLEFNTKKSKSFVGYYVEKDLKNQSIQPQLSESQKMFLSNIGDATDGALFFNIDSLMYSSSEIRYKIIDTLANGVFYDSVFVHSTNPDSAFYRIGFSQLGKGKGNYVLESNLSNGRVFKWVAPINGEMQGDYEPVIKLSPPKHMQMLTLGNLIEIGKKSRLRTEMAISSFDKNTFSRFDSHDNQGVAALIEYAFRKQINTRDSADTWVLSSNVSYEFISSYFSEIEPFRSVEFVRNFGLNDLNIERNQHSAQINVALQNRYHQFSWGAKNLIMEDLYNGYQNQWNQISRIKKFTLVNEGFYLWADKDSSKSKLLNHKTALEYDFKILKTGVILSLEENLHIHQLFDSLMPNSIGFQQAEWYLSESDSSKTEYRLHYINRIDKTPFHDKLIQESKSDEFGLKLNILKHDNHRLVSTAIYRNRIYSDTIYGKSESNIGSSLDYSGSLIGKTLKLNTFYESSGGQEQRRDFYFLKVAKGTGNFVWKDYNENGIEELDEFEQTVFTDQGEYIKLWRTTNDYIQTYNNRFQQNIQISAPNDWMKKNGIKGFIARFSNHFNFRSDKKVQNNPSQAYNPLLFKIPDTNLVSINQVIRNSFVINQRSPLWSHEFVYSKGMSKIFLTGGFEKRNFENFNSIFRLVLFKKVTSRTDFAYGEKQYLSDQFSNRNNIINHISLDQSANIIFTNNLRWILGYKYLERKNILPQFEKLFSTVVSSELNINIPNKGILNWKLSMVKNTFNGDQNQAVAFEMMEGLSDGLNFLSSLNMQTNLGQNLQLNANYEIRYTQTSKMVHVGNITLRAYF